MLHHFLPKEHPATLHEEQMRLDPSLKQNQLSE